MNSPDAVALIAEAVTSGGGTWADLGAGHGTFTRALVELLGPSARIYAVDRDEKAVAALGRWSAADAPNVVAVTADFTRRFELPALQGAVLDGILLANALHFARDAGPVLARLVERLRPGGRVVLVEYDRRAASPWVPHPIPISRLPALAAAAGLLEPKVIAKRASEFGGIIYVAAADRPAVDRGPHD